MAEYVLDLVESAGGYTPGVDPNLDQITAFLTAHGVTVTSVTIIDRPARLGGRSRVAIVADTQPELLEQAWRYDFANDPGWLPAPVQTEWTYTRFISDTQWATTVNWSSGALIPTESIHSYLTASGYDTTTDVTADLSTGVVTITAESADQVDAPTWAAYDGGISISKDDTVVFHFFDPAVNAESIGVGSIAKNEWAFASGPHAQALRDGSTASGSFAKALHVASTAYGYNSQASRSDSTALGAYSKAHGARTFALGSTSFVGDTEFDVGEARANHVRQERSWQQGATTYGLRSPDHTWGVIGITDDDRLTVNDKIVGAMILVHNAQPVLLGVPNTSSYTDSQVITEHIYLPADTYWEAVFQASATLWRSVTNGEVYLRMRVGGQAQDEIKWSAADDGVDLSRPIRTEVAVERSNAVNGALYGYDGGFFRVWVEWRGGGAAATTYIKNAVLTGWLTRVG